MTYKDLAASVELTDYCSSHGYSLSWCRWLENIMFTRRSDGSEKRTYREATPGVRNIEYGNIEICVGPKWNRDAAYVSYNYGNNTFSHILIDLFGYWGRGY